MKLNYTAFVFSVVVLLSALSTESTAKNQDSPSVYPDLAEYTNNLKKDIKW